MGTSQKPAEKFHHLERRRDLLPFRPLASVTDASIAVEIRGSSRRFLERILCENLIEDVSSYPAKILTSKIVLQAARGGPFCSVRPLLGGTRKPHGHPCV